MIHAAHCKRSQDIHGRWWHTASCESAEANYRYALGFSGDARYARLITNMICVPVEGEAQ
jgi:hypothetical protein